MYDIAYIIVTKDRKQVIKDHLFNVYDYYIENNIGIYIVDGSDENHLSKYINENYINNVHYFFKPDLSFTDRVLYGLDHVKAKYVCITGDSQIPRIEKISKLKFYMENNFDLIVFSHRDNKKIGYKEYQNIIEIFKDNCWDMTCFGTVYFKATSYLPINKPEFLSKYHDNYFPQIAIYFDYFKNSNFKGVYIGESLIKYSQYKKRTYWNDNMLDTFGRQWVEIIEKLDKKYDVYKKQVILDHGIYSSLKINWSYGFIKWRSNNNLNIDKFYIYKDVISKISNVKIWKIKLIALTPKWICFVIFLGIKIFYKLILRGG